MFAYIGLMSDLETFGSDRQWFSGSQAQTDIGPPDLGLGSMSVLWI